MIGFLILLAITLISLCFSLYFYVKYRSLSHSLLSAELEGTSEAIKLKRQNSHEMLQKVNKIKEKEIALHKQVFKTKKKVMKKEMDKQKEESSSNSDSDDNNNSDKSSDVDNNNKQNQHNVNEDSDKTDNNNTSSKKDKNKDNTKQNEFNKLMNLNKDELNDRKLVSVSESCTGGLINSYMCESLGCSSWYSGGIVAYNLYSKSHYLGVNIDNAYKVNCVSPAVAREMAKGVSRMFNTIWGISSTGYLDEYFNHKPIVYYCLFNTDNNKELHGEINWDGKMNRKEFILYSSRKIYNIAQKVIDLPTKPWLLPED